jgi:hypothetical protein
MSNGSGRGKVLFRPKASTPTDTTNNLGGQPPWSKLKTCNPNNGINQMGQGHLFEANLTIVAKVPHKRICMPLLCHKKLQNIMSQV